MNKKKHLFRYQRGNKIFGIGDGVAGVLRVVLGRVHIHTYFPDERPLTEAVCDIGQQQRSFLVNRREIHGRCRSVR